MFPDSKMFLGEQGFKYAVHRRVHCTVHYDSQCNLHITRQIRTTQRVGLQAAKTLIWEGATPPHFGRPSAAQRSVGSLPACHHRTVTVFCPRAYRNVSRPSAEKEELRIRKGANTNGGLESTTEATKNHCCPTQA